MLPNIHTMITLGTLRRLGYGKNVQHVVGTTSRWSDWYRWTSPVEHANTPYDDQARPIDPSGAAEKCSVLLADFLQKVEMTSSPERYVWLGFAFHLVQDLATHRGMTNAEHIFRVIRFWENPDYSTKSIQLGSALSLKLCMALEERLSPGVFDELRKSNDARVLYPSERERLLGRKDMRFPSLRQVIREYTRYRRLPRDVRDVRWDVQAVFEDGALHHTDGNPIFRRGKKSTTTM